MKKSVLPYRLERFFAISLDLLIYYYQKSEVWGKIFIFVNYLLWQVLRLALGALSWR